MIFITLGSQKFQFNRILKKVDELISEGIITDKVFAQIGDSDYEPQNYEYKRFLNREEFAKKQEECDVVITHGGTGAIIGAVRKGKKVIAVPRLAKYGEHVDDHQLQLIHQFDDMNIIEPCYDLEKLDIAYKRLLNTNYNTYISNTKRVLSLIDNSIISDVDSNRKNHKSVIKKFTKLIMFH